MPVGLYGGRRDIMGVVAPDGPAYQAGTLSGNPVAMAAGLATMEKLTPAFYAALEANAAEVDCGLRDHPRLHCPRYGSLLWPLFQDGVRRSDAVKGEAISTFNRLHKALLGQASAATQRRRSGLPRRRPRRARARSLPEGHCRSRKGLCMKPQMAQMPTR